jgi:hypothetical protein
MSAVRVPLSTDDVYERLDAARAAVVDIKAGRRKAG